MESTSVAAELERLSRLSFEGWNESDVREDFIAPLLDLLGYSRNSDYEINREGQHLLLRQFRRLGRDRIRIDYKLVVRKRSFWLIEAKAPLPEIPIDDVDQAFLYAQHPEVRARFFVVCNGVQTDVYDVRNPDERVLSIAARDLPRRFGELNQVLGAQSLINHLHEQLICDLRSVLAVEVLEDRPRLLQARLNTAFTEAAPVIQQNRVNVFRVKLAEDETEWRRLVESATGSLQIATDVMHAMLSLNQFGVADSALKHWLGREDESTRERTIKALIGQLTTLLATHRRFNVLRMLVRLRHCPFVPAWKSTIDTAIAFNIKSALTGFDDNVLLKLAWLLEGALYRVLYKATFCDAGLAKDLETIVQQKLSMLTAEDRVLGDPTVDGERLAVAHHTAVSLFPALIRQPVQAIQGAFANLLAAERKWEPAFEKAVQGRRLSLHTYAQYHRPFDFMSSQLFHVLAFEFEDIVDLIDDEIVRRTCDVLAKMTSDEAYAVTHAEDFLARALWKRDCIHWDCDRPAAVFPSTLRGVFVHRSTRPPITTVRIWGAVAGGYAELFADLDLAVPRLNIKSARALD